MRIPELPREAYFPEDEQFADSWLAAETYGEIEGGSS